MDKESTLETYPPPCKVFWRLFQPTPKKARGANAKHNSTESTPPNQRPDSPATRLEELLSTRLRAAFAAREKRPDAESWQPVGPGTRRGKKRHPGSPRGSIPKPVVVKLIQTFRRFLLWRFFFSSMAWECLSGFFRAFLFWKDSFCSWAGGVFLFAMLMLSELRVLRICAFV